MLSTEDLTKLAPDWGIVRTNIKSLTAANFQAGVVATTAQATAKTTRRARVEFMAKFSCPAQIFRRLD